MVQIDRTVERIAPTDLSVLITGESGVGKEIIARRIHALSPRSGQVFQKINSAALPTSLLEAELFGHRKGAFTGAHADRKGRVEAAHQGTLFFDEIAELEPESQVKLLQIIHEREFASLGSHVPVKVDVRILAATNRNLWDEVERGSFREDLYYRLNVAQIHVPALRDCKEDIPRLFDYFWDRYTAEFDRAREMRIRDRDYALLREYDWPGNVRELENFVKKVVLVEDGNSEFQLLRQRIRQQKLHVGSQPSLLEAARSVGEEVERKIISRVLGRNGWNRKKTAQMLRISYRSLLNKIKKLEIE